MRPAHLLTAALCLLATACAGASPAPAPPAPSEIPDLEALVAGDSTDAEAALLLAAAYREVGRADEARRVVEAARGAHPDQASLLAMAGLLHEEAGAWDEARATYQEYLSRTPRGSMRDEVLRRLEHVRREALRGEVRDALAREAALAATPPDPSTVGVFPFVFEGGDDTWTPLGTALAELLTTDLGVTGRLTVLERARVQALLDEMALAEAGVAEPATAARSGRLLGAGHLVQGRYRVESGGRLGVDAAVVPADASPTRGITPIRAEDDLQRLFDLEKRLALDIHAELGVVLTPAERARVSERQTESVQALLAFGRGLAAADAGDFEAAEESFARAAQLDPGFRLAVTRRAQAASAGRGGAQRLSGQATRLAQRRRAVQALRQAPAGIRQQVLRNMSSRQRAALAEVLGQDRLGTAVLLELVFRPPGGAP